MSGTIGAAIGLVLLGGFLQGSFALPMKRMPRLRWENRWLVHSSTGKFILPWTTVFLMIPHQGWAMETDLPLPGMVDRCI